ncbi:hypothetical protein [Fodinicola feengrottensis]|uniref:hypothetical protein n=1 Tax=Fodinicola feengrottensis TaxID=435914 RepID=UPI0013CF96DD|nr:hypothetical protein [Fodinicola feengrottensis]
MPPDAGQGRTSPQEAFPDLHADQGRGEQRPADMDPGGVHRAEATSESAEPVLGTYTPDVGPGGSDVDTSRTATTPGRYRTESPGRDAVDRVSDDAE